MRDIRQRWARFSREVLAEFDVFASAPVINEIPKDPARQRVYMEFFQAQIDEILLVTDSAPNWQAQYQLQSYTQAVESTRSDLIRQGVGIAQTPAEAIATAGFTAEIATLAPLAATHQEILDFLYTRSYESLKGWTDAMAREVREITMEAVLSGEGIRDTRARIRDRISVNKSRAELIARTEVIQAYQRASIAETERAIQETGEDIKMVWITALDSRVRHLHARWHGTTATPEDNSRRVSVSPYNCRCAQKPVIEELLTDKRKAKFADERERLLTLEVA
jgi:SPP1 gp7 family putative phage head morphogenesis protein